MTVRYSVIAPGADLRETPDALAPRGKLESQLVFGEIFVAEAEKNGWCKGHCAHDKYAGWMERRFLAPVTSAPTHVVTAARSHLYREPAMKSACLGALSFGSMVTVAETGDGYARTAGGWICEKHIAPIATKEEDYIATAKKFLETPYYWGGRSGFGIDCSGLVQVALGRAGINAPRDTEQQAGLGAAADRPHTGDLVFFKGHVGIMADQDNILHANAFHMKTVIEPLWQAEERSKGITAVRRI